MYICLGLFNFTIISRDTQMIQIVKSLLGVSDTEFYNELHIISHLSLWAVGGFITSDSSALCASVDDYISLLCIRLCRHRLHKTLALACAVSRVFVKMAAPEAIGAMVS